MECTEAVPRRKCTAVNAYVEEKKRKGSKINNLFFHFRNQKKKSKLSPNQAEGRKQQIRAEINKTKDTINNRENEQNPKLVL